MQKNIQCQFELTAQQIIKFQFLHLYTNPAVFILTVFGMVHIALICFTLAANGWTAISDTSMFSWVFGLLVLLIPLMAYRGGRKTAANRLVQETRSYTFTAEGIEYESASQSVRLMWSDFKYLQKSRKMLFFYVNPSCAQLVPVSSFASAAELEQAVAWARAGMPRGGKRRGRWLFYMIIYLLIFLVTVGVVHFISTQPGG